MGATPSNRVSQPTGWDVEQARVLVDRTLFTVGRKDLKRFISESGVDV
jgi:hypothetical protein